MSKIQFTTFPLLKRKKKVFWGKSKISVRPAKKKGMNKVMPKFEKNIQVSLTICGGSVLEKFEIREYQNHRFMHRFGRNCVLFPCVCGFPPVFWSASSQKRE